jgi:hypothetical protein
MVRDAFLVVKILRDVPPSCVLLNLRVYAAVLVRSLICTDEFTSFVRHCPCTSMMHVLLSLSNHMPRIGTKLSGSNLAHEWRDRCSLVLLSNSL